MDEYCELETPESDEEPLTARNVLQKLESSWLNEKFSPEILKHQSDIVDCMLEQIQQMEENVQKLKKNDFRVIIHRMELDRIRFVIASYLRTRLEKIENFTLDILDQEDNRSAEEGFLSSSEAKFAHEYIFLMEKHIQTLALRHMPSNLQTWDKVKMRARPNVHSHVFLRVNKDVPGVVVEGDNETGEEEIDLGESTQHIMQYQPISHLVKNGDVQLI